MRRADTYADVEVRILKKEDNGYWVELTCNGVQEFPRGELAPVVLPHTLDPEKLGEALFEQLFADDHLKRGWAIIRGQYPLRRIRLRIDADAPELHTIPWELLRDATSPDLTSQTLAADADTPFSRYLAGEWPPGRPVDSRPIKLLIALASPTNLNEYSLSTIDVMTEQQTLQTAFTEAEVPAEQLDITFLPQSVTLTAIEQALKQKYHLLHIIAHGMFLKDDNVAVLFLANKSNTVQQVTDQEFASMLQRLGAAHVLQLVFLSSCQTATGSAADAYRGFAPTIVKAGVPTVVAMQANVPIRTARQFAAAFYHQLLQHGQVDLACNEARSAVLTAKLYGAGIPVLFMRLRDEQLFRYDLQPSEETSGKLYGVPELPPHFLERPEKLDSLKAMILGDKTQPVAVTGVAHKIGVHGMGGIGKTVLAATLARDEEVRQRFPDGVFWIVLGQTPDLVARQQQVARTLSGKPEAFVDVQEGKARLQELLADRACLLVLDDAWEMPHISVFNVVGEHSQLLITTRNANLITGLGGETYNLDLLTPEQARELLATWSNQSNLSGHPERTCPERSRRSRRADEIIKECGYLPLAIAMVGAMLRDQTSEEDWQDVLTLLREAKLEEIEQVFPDYEHPNLFRTLHVSVNALVTDIRERYLDFAVFPEDTPIPAKVLETFWSSEELKRIQIKKILRTLKDRSLLQWDETDMLTLHDLQRDYVRAQAGDDLPALHQRLLDAYKQQLPNSPLEGGQGDVNWENGPNNGYFFENLCYHLHEAKDIEELHDLLFHFPWLQAKLEACGVNALLSDYDLLPQEGELKLLRQTLQLSAHILVQDPAQLPSQLHGRLCSQTTPGIKTLLTRTRGNALWLRPVTCSFTPPGGALLRTLTGHTDWINALAVMPDGTQIVSASWDKTLKVWDLRSGEELCTLSGHTGRVNAVAVTPDGRQVVSASEDKTLRIWDLASGAEQRILTGHTEEVTAVAVTPDGRQVVLISYDDLKVWDLASGEARQILVGHTEAVNAVVVTPDGRQLVSASSDKTLKVWDLRSGEVLRTLTGHTGSDEVVALAPDGRQVGPTSNDGFLKVVYELSLSFTGVYGVLAVAVTPDGQQVVSASSDKTLKVWDLASGEEQRTLAGHTEAVNAVVVTPDGRQVVSASSDKTLKVWDLASGEEQCTLTGHTDVVNAVAMTPDGRRVVSASSDKTLKVWDLRSDEARQIRTGHTRAVMAVAVTPDGRRVVSASSDKTLKVWDLRSGEERCTFIGHTDMVTAVAVTPDGRQVVSASYDETLKVWDLSSSEELRTFTGHTSLVITVAVTPDGRQVVSASDDKILEVWDLNTGNLLSTFSANVYLLCCAVTPDGRQVVLASPDKTLKVWDLRSGEELRSLIGHTDMVTAVAVTPDGTQVVSASFDRTLKVWDLSSGAERQTLAGHTDAVTAVAVTPDGRRVISASNDQMLKVWDLKTGDLLTTFYADAKLSCCAVAPDGATIVTGDHGGMVHFLGVENNYKDYT